MEYDMELGWKAGVEHVVPDALSRLPVASPVEVDVDDSFPDDLSSATAGASVETLGPELDGVRLGELDPAQADHVGDADSQTSHPTSHPTSEVVDSLLSSFRALPVAACAALTLRRMYLAVAAGTVPLRCNHDRSVTRSCPRQAYWRPYRAEKTSVSPRWKPPIRRRRHRRYRRPPFDLATTT